MAALWANFPCLIMSLRSRNAAQSPEKMRTHSLSTGIVQYASPTFKSFVYVTSKNL
jgi:hypothetical protein